MHSKKVTRLKAQFQVLITTSQLCDLEQSISLLTLSISSVKWS